MKLYGSAGMQPEILYEDNHILAVNKPAGMLTQPDNSHQPSLEMLCRHWLKEKYDKKGNVFLAAVHRLDKPASGVVLFAKTSKALSRLNASMRSRQTRKVYLAELSRLPENAAGVLIHYLVHGDHKAIVSNPDCPQAKEARLTYKILRQHPPVVEIELDTGRYHQIRAQFAAIHCPLMGDTKYGGLPGSSHAISLHHSSLTIPHPITQEPLTIQAPPPEHISV
jgi:23S rRNA pseudouridine1911/1915/1917 synthase